MKLVLSLLALMMYAAPVAEIRHFQYQRPVDAAVKTAGQSCLAIDPAIYPHAEQQLADLRLYHDGTVTPYALRSAALLRQNDQTISPVNLGVQGSNVVFDAAMPLGTYGNVSLDVSAQDFIAAVTVTSVREAGNAPTKLGTFTIFDFTRQKLGRSTVLHLPPSNFPHLHFQVTRPLHPENIHGLSLSRVASRQPLYQAVAQSSEIRQQGQVSVVEFTLPAHVPVDRVTFVSADQPLNFSRMVTVRVVDLPAHPTGDAEPPQPRIFGGNLLRLHRLEEGHRIDEERLSIDVPMDFAPEASKWTVTVVNGDDAPVPFSRVQLEVLEHDLCFDAAPSGKYTLYYGDPALAAPHYDYADLFQLQADGAHATAGPEQANPQYQPREDERSFTDRHPILLWAALILVILTLAGIALGTAKRPSASP